MLSLVLKRWSRGTNTFPGSKNQEYGQMGLRTKIPNVRKLT